MTKKESSDNFDVIVIGAGVGGLTAASLLAKAGKKVLLVEKEPKPGGFVSALIYQSYQFDTAARLIMGCTADSPFGPGPVYTLLSQLGVLKQCEFIRVQPFVTMRLPGSSFQMWSGRHAFMEGLKKEFPTGLENLPHLFDLFSRIYRGVISFSTASNPWGLLKIPFLFPDLIRYRNATVEDVLVRYIPDLRPRTAVASLWPYIGLTPGRSSFLMWATMMASYIEEGAFFCKGGLHRLADVVANAFINQGGELMLGSEVTKILVKNGAANGVELASGQKFFAPNILCGIDCRHAFSESIDPRQLPHSYRNRLDRLEPSIMALNISLITDLDLPALGFGFETLFFDSWDVEQVWRNLINGQIGIFSMTMTTAADPSLARPGQHLVSALCGLPAEIKRTPEATKKLGATLLAEIEKNIPELTNHLVFAKNGALTEGYIDQVFSSIYGWAATPQQIGIHRLGQRTPLKGLYLVGHWTQPGHGVISVVLSGMAVAKTILK
ncbi:MAG: NAD(P)/FAD-dependent oxidoreductase [Deltaproteobacteria bacterium]|nr:NAD(P)/FAD-dependent oxidoreductase [Deltaproteobacteria bacterium]